jgi:hypothetical protein
MDEVEAIVYSKTDIKFHLTFYMFVPNWIKVDKGNVHIDLLSDFEFHANNRSEKKNHTLLTGVSEIISVLSACRRHAVAQLVAGSIPDE